MDLRPPVVVCPCGSTPKLRVTEADTGEYAGRIWQSKCRCGRGWTIEVARADNAAKIPHREAYKCEECGASVKKCSLCENEARFWVTDDAFEKSTLYLCESHSEPYQIASAADALSEQIKEKILNNTIACAGFGMAREVATYQPGHDGCRCDSWA